MKQFGLIGKTLKHSFSKNYFTEKFNVENIQDCSYELFELSDISQFSALVQSYGADLKGLNVTIPYKKEVMPYLHELDDIAKAIQAVNTIKPLPNGQLKGYNTDYFGFKNSLQEWDTSGVKALILGTGGASNAVRKVLEDITIPYRMVSRNSSEQHLTYDDISNHPELVSEHQLIINTTPLGTFPNVDEVPQLPYNMLKESHMLFDLVYNPEVTAFMKAGLKVNAKVKNGYDMLVGQAEAAWKIWNDIK